VRGLVRKHRPRGRRGSWWTLLQLSGVGILLGALAALGVMVSAGATEPGNGDTISNAAQPIGTVTPGPFDSGQTISVSVPANTAFANQTTTGINILECSAANGVLPTSSADCDGLTIQGSTIEPNADGSFTYDDYQVFALPDKPTFGEPAGGVACGNTVATECVLYIGEDQLDFTQPHLWSQFFFVKTDPTDSGTADPGDGTAPAAATEPDPSLSTAVASPTTATADGSDSSTVTVTLLGTGNIPVTGKAVSLTPSSGTAQVTGPSPAQTDSNGQTTFTVTDTAAETVILTAKDTTDSITLTQQPSVTFQTPAPDPAHSTVSANPTNPPADGTTATTITVTIRDQAASPQPVAGQTVTLAGSGHAQITPAVAPDVTNAQGQAIFTATDATAETVTFTATDVTDSSTVIPNTGSVTFGTLSVSASASTVTADASNPVGTVGGTATVTLLSASSSPIVGKTVDLSTNSSTTTVKALGSNPGVTDANGQAQFQVTDTAAESVQLTAVDSTDTITLTQQPTMTFVASGSASATNSTVVAAGTTSPADGETQTEITIVVKDQFGSPVSGDVLSVTGSSVNTSIHPFSTGTSGDVPGTSDGTGTAIFEVSDTIAETVTYTATDTSAGGITLGSPVQITYTPGPLDAAGVGTTVKANPTNPPADGTTATTITVTVGDHFGNPLSGKTVSLAALNGNSKIPTTTGVTNAQGQATFTATDSTQEFVTYQATDVTDNNAVLAPEATVTFGNPPSPPAAASYCSVSAAPASVPADGTSTATVSVLLYDDNGYPAAGKTVTLTGGSGNSTVTVTNGTTNTSGMATFTVSDTTAESVKYTANDTSDTVSLSAIPVTVTFTAAAATSSTTTSTTSTTSSSSTTTTATGSTGAGVTSPAVSTASATGNSGTSSSGSGASLADTGASPVLLWLAGLGALFLGIGTVGRRRFKGARHEA
jgi:Bacterial Ig-like domain (group 1)